MPEPEPRDDVEAIDEHAPRERLALIVAALGVVVLALVAVCIVQFISVSRLEQRLADADARLDNAARRARQDAEVITTLTDGLKAAQDLCDKLQQATGRFCTHSSQWRSGVVPRSASDHPFAISHRPGGSARNDSFYEDWHVPKVLGSSL